MVLVMDIWMIMCLFFVFGCLVEFIVVVGLLRHSFKQEAYKVVYKYFFFYCSNFEDSVPTINRPLWHQGMVRNALLSNNFENILTIIGEGEYCPLDFL